ncbi:MAG TPA: hypothetical protein VFV57_12650 [Limnobacter sp.]|nr:hypothetical protein [Limnobacter sp.]
MNLVDPSTSGQHSWQALQPHAPQEAVEQFNKLLAGTNQAFGQGNTALAPQTDHAKSFKADPLQDTANRLHRAEVALEELQSEIRKDTQTLEATNQYGSDTIRAVADLKYKTSAYFMNIMRTESGFSSLAEEAESLTKKRS